METNPAEPAARVPAAISAGPRETDTLIIGAGPSGLAMAACLRNVGVPFIIVEARDNVGYAWRNHYDRLHLHTVKVLSNLPYLRFPDHVEKYPSRRAVVDYLDAYARHFAINPHFNEEVTSVRSADGLWETVTTANHYRSGRVVICTGYNRRPVIPAWPGQESFRGTIIHSAEYRNGRPYSGKRVLVVGIGNTGGEIAVDLHEYGAAAVHICVRSPINVIPRDLWGMPAQVTGILLSKLPEPMAFFLSKRLARMAMGDLSKYGIRWPDIGPAEHVTRHGRVPLIDIGTVALIKKGVVKVVPAIDRITETGVVFANGEHHDYDALILATGYKAALDGFLECAAEVTDDRGYPVPPAGESSRRGLYFLGYVNPTTGLLRQIAIDAQRIAKDIVFQARAEHREVSNV